MTFVTGKNDDACLAADWHLSQIFAILSLGRKANNMCKKFTPDELNKMDHKTKNDVIYQMQDRLDCLEQNYENLMEQVRLAISSVLVVRQKSWMTSQVSSPSLMRQRRTAIEKVPEPTVEEVIDPARKVPKKPKKKGQREEDLRDFPQEE